MKRKGDRMQIIDNRKKKSAEFQDDNTFTIADVAGDSKVEESLSSNSSDDAEADDEFGVVDRSYAEIINAPDEAEVPSKSNLNRK